MRRSKGLKYSIFTAGIAVTASAAGALPTDVGRSADVAASATRYFAAVNPQKVGPTISIAADEIYAVSLTPIDPATIDFATALEDVAFEGSLAGLPLAAGTIDTALNELAFGSDVTAMALSDGQITEAMQDVAFENDLIASVVPQTRMTEIMQDFASQGAVAATPLSPTQVTRSMEDVVFQTPLAPQLAPVTALKNALEDDAFHVALAPVDMTTIDVAGLFDDVLFAVPLVPRETASLQVQPMSDDDAFQIATVPVDGRTLSFQSENVDDAFDVSVTARNIASRGARGQVLSTDYLEAVVAQAFDANDPLVTAVGVGAQASTASAGSSRVPANPDAMMTELLAAENNLVLREGEGDRPDTMMMSSDVLFAFGQSDLSDEAKPVLAEIGQMLGSEAVLEVMGHTDAIGSERANLVLAQKRAEVVRDWLLANSALTETQIVATGIGEIDPVAPNLTANGNDNPEGRALNRRVEFTIR